MSEITTIQNFLSHQTLAVVGASRDEKKFGYQVVKELLKKGKRIIIVHPIADHILGCDCVKEVSLLPEHVQHIFVVTPMQETLKVLQKLAQRGADSVWIQQKSQSSEAIAFAEKQSFELIKNRCILMYAEPVAGIHNIHKIFNKLFKTYAK